MRKGKNGESSVDLEQTTVSIYVVGLSTAKKNSLVCHDFDFNHNTYVWELTVKLCFLIIIIFPFPMSGSLVQGADASVPQRQDPHGVPRGL